MIFRDRGRYHLVSMYVVVTVERKRRNRLVLSVVPLETRQEIEEFDDAGNLRYKKGLRIRKVDDSSSVMEFDVRMSGHGKTFALELDQDTRALLKSN